VGERAKVTEREGGGEVMREVRTRERDREKVREREVGRGECSEVDWRGEGEEERGRGGEGGGERRQIRGSGWMGREGEERDRERNI